MNSHLLVWKILLVPIFGGISFLLCVDPYRLENYRRTELFKAYLQDIQFQKNQNGVLIIGNSLLQHALPPYDVVTKRVNSEIKKQSKGEIRYEFRVIAIPGLQTSLFTNNANEIFSRNPKVIGIQSELMFSDFISRQSRRSFSEELERRAGWIQKWSRVLKVALFPSFQQIRIPARTGELLGTVKNPGLNVNLQLRAMRNVPELQTQHIEDIWKARKIRETDLYYQICKEFIQKAHESGIQIMVLDMPVSIHALSVAPPGYLKERAAAIRKILQPGDVYLEFNGALADKYYYDFAHLRPQGRAVFSQWMIETFVRDVAHS